MSRPPDHPRSRGVYTFAHSSFEATTGSSPLARGLPAPTRGRRPGTGIIPARAGFTRNQLKTCASSEDHPRSRGVYFAQDPILSTLQGSSPLARGLQQACRVPQVRSGIIPARAGFTILSICSPPSAPDHPRSRGVYDRYGQFRYHYRGSSPLARGLRRSSWAVGRRPRIIPARAGFTSASRTCGSRTWDHPRSRGVYICLGY